MLFYSTTDIFFQGFYPGKKGRGGKKGGEGGNAPATLPSKQFTSFTPEFKILKPREGKKKKKKEGGGEKTSRSKPHAKFKLSGFLSNHRYKGLAVVRRSKKRGGKKGRGKRGGEKGDHRPDTIPMSSGGGGGERYKTGKHRAREGKGRKGGKHFFCTWSLFSFSFVAFCTHDFDAPFELLVSVGLEGRGTGQGEAWINPSINNRVFDVANRSESENGRKEKKRGGRKRGVVSHVLRIS